MASGWFSGRSIGSWRRSSLPVETSVHHEPAGEVKEVAQAAERQERQRCRESGIGGNVRLARHEATESKLPSLEELQRFADANPPAESWYDEDL